MTFEKQTVVFYAALKGYLDQIPLEKIQETEAKLLDYFTKLYENDIMKPIRESGELADAVEEKLKKALEQFLVTAGYSS
jgi:F-type H+-transporting ATPase subunit alpha